MSCYENMTVNFKAEKPFREWANWSHSWEGTKHYGFTGGKYKDGLYKGLTQAQAEKMAYEQFWQRHNLDGIKDGNIAICCMWCVFWTGNAHLIYQAVENPKVSGGRPKPIPKGHAVLDKKIIDKINTINPKKLFNDIKRQLGWFTVNNMQEKYHNGLMKRWFSVNYGPRMLKNGQSNKTMSKTDFLAMLDKL